MRSPSEMDAPSEIFFLFDTIPVYLPCLSKLTDLIGRFYCIVM